jgi:hypothetical protein
MSRFACVVQRKINAPEPVPHERKTKDISSVSESTEALEREKDNKTVFVMTNYERKPTPVFLWNYYSYKQNNRRR